MPIQTTIEIPEPLHEILQTRAAQAGTSTEALILDAIEQFYGRELCKKGKGTYVTEPPIKLKPGAKLGPLFPVDENPYDLILP